MGSTDFESHFLGHNDLYIYRLNISDGRGEGGGGQRAPTLTEFWPNKYCLALYVLYLCFIVSLRTSRKSNGMWPSPSYCSVAVDNKYVVVFPMSFIPQHPSGVLFDPTGPTYLQSTCTLSTGGITARTAS